MSSRRPGHRSRSRGVSLIEAIVALAVMGFGMLGIAAMQSSLRQNSDTARQRAEATRLASEAIEAMRSYSVVNTASGKISYADLVTGVAAPQLALPSTITGTNATYTRTVEVNDTGAQNRKTVFVKITWAENQRLSRRRRTRGRHGPLCGSRQTRGAHRGLRGLEWEVPFMLERKDIAGRECRERGVVALD